MSASAFPQMDLQCDAASTASPPKMRWPCWWTVLTQLQGLMCTIATPSPTCQEHKMEERLPLAVRGFIALPFEHSENLADQEVGSAQYGGSWATVASGHS